MAVQRNLLRSLPSVFVAALVVLAAHARSNPPGPRPLAAAGKAAPSSPHSAGRVVSADGTLAGPEPAFCDVKASSYVPASAFVQGPPGEELWAIQPGAITVTASGLSMVLMPAGPVTWTAEVVLYAADSPTGDPFFGTVPLERGAGLAAPGPQWVDQAFSRPIVVRRAAGLPPAVTATATLSMRLAGADPHSIGFDPDGPQSLGPAVFATTAGTFDPLPGPHAVLAHQVCSGAVEDADLRVLQDAVLANGNIPTATAELVQSFTVPVTATADWVELAVRSTSPLSPLEVSIYDPAGLAMPGAGALPATATAATIPPDAMGRIQPPVWAATAPLAQRARLEANHTYWLMVRTNSRWGLHSASEQGGAGYPGGELFFRNGSTGSFTLSGSNDLSFRLIGTEEFGDPGPPPACVAGIGSSVVTVTASLGLGDDLRVAQVITLKGQNFGSSLRSLSFPTAPSVETVTFTAVAAIPGGPLGEPDPLKVALRDQSIAVSPSAERAVWSSFSFDRPLVVRAVTGTAETSDEFLSLQLIGPPAVTATAQVGYDEASVSGLPPLLRQSGGGAWQPVAGAHPVLAHATCETDPQNGIDPPYVAMQQILSGPEVLTATSTYEAIQSLRVPYAAHLDWLEVATSVTQTAGLAPLEIEVIAPRVGSPLAGLEGPVVATLTAAYSTPHAWTGTAVFRTAETTSGERPLLTPGADYWLRYRTNHLWDLPASPSTLTAYSEGRLYTKSLATDPYSEDLLRNLSFRLIGVVRDIVAAPSPVTLTAMVAGSVTITAATPVVFAASVDQPLAVTVTATVGPVYMPVMVDGPAGATVTVTLVPGGPDAVLSSVPRGDTYPFGAVTITAGADPDWRAVSFDRPIVFQSVTLTAEASSGDLHLVLTEKQSQPGRPKVGYGTGAAVSATAALRQRPDFGWEQLPGPMAVLGHVVTRSPDPDADRFRALQQMLTLTRVCCVTHTCCLEWSVEKIQTFRVPVAGRADWIELAIPAGQGDAPPIEVAIIDPGAELEPSPLLPPATATATIVYRGVMAEQSSWTGSVRFPSPPHLVPGRDYWLLVRTAGAWRLGIAADYAEGRLYFRDQPDGPWSEQQGEDLGFRIIGVPDDLVGVETAPPRPRVFQLIAGPNPFSRDLAFRWSGGTGRVRIEVFDVNGRRVRQVRDAGDAAEGTWVWRGDGDRGHPLGAGVYFTRVVLADGRAHERRVVLVR